MAGRGTTIIHSDAKHQEWKLRFLGGVRGGYEPRFSNHHGAYAPFYIYLKQPHKKETAYRQSLK